MNTQSFHVFVWDNFKDLPAQFWLRVARSCFNFVIFSEALFISTVFSKDKNTIVSYMYIRWWLSVRKDIF